MTNAGDVKHDRLSRRTVHHDTISIPMTATGTKNCHTGMLLKNSFASNQSVLNTDTT